MKFLVALLCVYVVHGVLATAAELVDSAPSVLYTTEPLSDSQVVPDTIDVLPQTTEEGFPQMIGTEGSESELLALGVKVLNKTLSQPFGQIEKAWRLSQRRQGPVGYHSPDELLFEFRLLTSRFPQLATILNLMDELKTPLTVEGRSIYALKVSDNVNDDEDEPNVLIVSAHHCRELVTPELALDQATRLLEGYGTDPVITQLVNDHQVYIIWSMNPDGAEYVWNVNNMWRKNRKQNVGGSYGIDLNRNYPMGWDFSCGGSTVPTSQTYRGLGPISESEPQMMVAFHADRHFVKVIDHHSSGREVRQNYGTCAPLPPEIDSLFGVLATSTAAVMPNYRPARSCCTGGQIHAAYRNQGSLAFLTETATSFQPPQAAMRQELEYVWPGVLHFLEIPTSIYGHVRSASTNQPLEVTFSIPQLNYQQDEVVAYTKLPYARYHIWIPDGLYTFVITSGAETFVEQVTVVQGTERDFLL